MTKLEEQTYASEVQNFVLSWLHAEINYKAYRLKQTAFIPYIANTAQKSVKAQSSEIGRRVFW